VVCGLLRARVTTEKDLVVLRSASVRVKCTDFSFVENLVTPVIGVVCDLLHARVTAEKDSVVLRSASVRV